MMMLMMVGYYSLLLFGHDFNSDGDDVNDDEYND